jgi:predicted nucleotidyltransferase
MKVNRLEDIVKPLKEKKQFLYDTFGVLKMGIFGSFAQGTQTMYSDIDIVIEMEKSKKNLSNFLALKRALEEEFGRPVDLGFEHMLKPIVRKNIKDKITYV